MSRTGRHNNRRLRGRYRIRCGRPRHGIAGTHFAVDRETEKYLPEYKNLDELKEHYRRGGLGDVKIKKFLVNVLQEELAPIYARRKEWEQKTKEVREILKRGCIAAESKAAKTLENVRKAMRINYFD